MKWESGASLIELIGVLAIAGVMTAGAIGVYQMIHRNQMRQIAVYQMGQIAGNTKLLMETAGDYSGVSVDYLIKAGALKSNDPPIGGKNWSVAPVDDNTGFAINLTDLSQDECEYFSMVSPKWATAVVINDSGADTKPQCFPSRTNKISFVVK